MKSTWKCIAAMQGNFGRKTGSRFLCLAEYTNISCFVSLYSINHWLINTYFQTNSMKLRIENFRVTIWHSSFSLGKIGSRFTQCLQSINCKSNRIDQISSHFSFNLLWVRWFIAFFFISRKAIKWNCYHSIKTVICTHLNGIKIQTVGEQEKGWESVIKILLNWFDHSIKSKGTYFHLIEQLTIQRKSIDFVSRYILFQTQVYVYSR